MGISGGSSCFAVCTNCSARNAAVFAASIAPVTSRQTRGPSTVASSSAMVVSTSGEYRVAIVRGACPTRGNRRGASSRCSSFMRRYIPQRRQHAVIETLSTRPAHDLQPICTISETFGPLSRSMSHSTPIAYHLRTGLPLWNTDASPPFRSLFCQHLPRLRAARRNRRRLRKSSLNPRRNRRPRRSS